MENIEQPPKPAPIDTTERTEVLDVLRGFALGGVFLSNVYIWMSGMVFQSGEGAAASMSSTLQKVIGGIYGVFVAGKFMTMFTFLFGLGLAVQFSRAAERNDSAPKRYVRRCMALIFLGVLHLTFLWYGDITHQYALIGLVVLLFRNRTTKTVVLWGLALTLFAVPIGMWLQFTLPRYLQSADVAQAAMTAKMAHEAEFNRNALATFQGHSYLAIVQMNLKMYWHHFFSPMIASYNVGTLGNFLLGLAVGRLGWFQDVSAHRTAFKRLLGWSALASILSFAIVALARHFMGGKGPMHDNVAMGIFMPLLNNIRTLAFALFYMSAITLLYQRRFFHRIFSIYAPAGRMAVTNYFAQSAIGLFVFCGIGLGRIGDLRPRWMVVMPMVMFGVQMACSWLWLRHFRFGPVEWISRSLTYGKMQPMRLPQSSSSEIAAPKP